MTACPGRLPGRRPFDHDAEHVALVLRAPWNGGALAVLVEHECQTWGCSMRLQPWTEPAKDPEAVLAKVLSRTTGVRVNLNGAMPHPEAVKALGGPTT